MTVRVQAKTALFAHCPVGSESMKDEEVAENIMIVYNQLTHVLPNHDNNIRNVQVKLTMGTPVKIQ